MAKKDDEVMQPWPGVFVKVTNERENHHGYQFHTGLNVLREPFDESSEHGGGFHFTTVEYVHRFINLGCYLREVTLPWWLPDFRMVARAKDGALVYKANMIVLGERHPLACKSVMHAFGIPSADLAPVRFYMDNCRDIGALRFLLKGRFDIAGTSAAFGHVHVLQWIHRTHEAADVHWERVLLQAVAAGHMPVVRWFREHVPQALTSVAMDVAASCGRPAMYTEVIAQLLEPYLLVLDAIASSGGGRRTPLILPTQQHHEIVAFLHEHGRGCTSTAVDMAAAAGNVRIVRFLLDNRTEGHTKQALSHAAANGHLEVVELLVERAMHNADPMKLRRLSIGDRHMNIREALMYALMHKHTAVAEHLRDVLLRLRE